MSYDFFAARIIFLRHGRTDWNASWRYQGITDVPCNEEGIEQGKRAVQRLLPWKPQVIYTSPLVRAAYLAETLAKESGAKLEANADITEYDFGEWEGLSITQIKENYGTMFDDWKKDPFGVIPPGAERIENLLGRTGVFAEKLKRLRDENIRRCVVVGHGYNLRAVMHACLELKDAANDTLWKLRMENCSLTTLDLYPDMPQLAFVNDTLHLNVPYDLISSLPIPD